MDIKATIGAATAYSNVILYRPHHLQLALIFISALEPSLLFSSLRVCDLENPLISKRGTEVTSHWRDLFKVALAAVAFHLLDTSCSVLACQLDLTPLTHTFEHVHLNSLPSQTSIPDQSLESPTSTGMPNLQFSLRHTGLFTYTVNYPSPILDLCGALSWGIMVRNSLLWCMFSEAYPHNDAVPQKRKKRKRTETEIDVNLRQW